MPLNAVLGLQVLALLFLIGASGFFSGAETALTALGKLRAKRLLTELDEEEHEGFRTRLQFWLDHSQDILVSILIGNNMVNIGASALATVVATEIFLNLVGVARSLAWGSGTAVGVMTFLILVFGEITPKSYAKQNPERFARFILPPIIGFYRGFYPLIVFMRGLTRFLIRMVGGRLPQEKNRITEEELKSLVLAGREEGTLEESELQMLHSVFEFDETVVREIMVPRIDIRALEVDERFDGVIEVARETGYSRLPVCEDSLDQIVGILNIKDLLTRIDRQGGGEDFDLRGVVRPAYFVPESKKVNQLLGEFRRNQVHMAIVVDEYGGTSGLITLEDILEQIVGEIQDEYDQERDWVLKIRDGTYLVDARIDLDDLAERLDRELPTEAYDSLGGMAVEEMGKIPDEGEQFHWDDMTFVVVSADPKRVKKIRIQTKQPRSSDVDGDTRETPSGEGTAA